ncbi:MAG: sensor histidine kinase [Ruminococcus sp.]|nr:sensor histidine kinase [Ruminococcus sp.]
MKHLFTPFYRADKSRNRATGGSGLGLYIVKTILDMHGMKCSISNTENGVAFRVVLPDAQNKASKRI